MKIAVFVALVFCGLQADATNPVAKVVQMLNDLKAQVIAEGHDSQAIYEEKCAWCEETSRELLYKIDEGNRESTELKAKIQQLSADIENLAAKMDELAESIAKATEELKAATAARAKERAAFEAAEKELVGVVDTLGRAIGILQRNAAGGALLQVQHVDGLVSALKTLVNAATISSADANHLTSLLQQTDAGAPDAEVYESHSGGIVDVLQDILGKAEAALADARKEESTSIHNFERLEQSLTDSVKYATEDKDTASADSHAATEAKAGAVGKLGEVTKALQLDNTELTSTRNECLGAANTHEEETASRSEEVEVIKKAVEIIEAATKGSTSQVYGLLQVSSQGVNLVKFLKKIAQEDGSASLTQLASRVSSAMRLSSDPFVKVRGLIEDMLTRLQTEAAEAADHKASCDKNLAENNAKHAALTAKVNKLNARLDKATADQTAAKNKLKATVAAQADLAKSSAEMNNIRDEEKAAYAKNQPELAQGLEGIKQALKILQEYYGAEGAGHEKNTDAAQGIIALIQVAESDTQKLLSEVESAERTAAADFERQTKENEVLKAQQEADVKYLKKQLGALKVKIGELNKDLSAESEQQAAVQATLDALHEECDVKVEPYAVRKAAREREIAGLKEALNILEDASFVQTGSRRSLRGAK